MRSLLRALLCVAVLAIGCSDEQKLPAVSSDSGLDALLQRALIQARADSASLAASRFTAVASMGMHLSQSSRRVDIIDTLMLGRDSLAGFVARRLYHSVSGDTSLLSSMYSFEDAKGRMRGEEQAHFTSINFGTSFPLLLLALRDGLEGEAGARLLDSTTMIEGALCYHIAYRTPEKEGEFWLDRATLHLQRLQVHQESNYVVGRYDYRAMIDFRSYGPGVLLPSTTAATFTYRRVFATGTGSIRVMLESVRGKE